MVVGHIHTVAYIGLLVARGTACISWDLDPMELRQIGPHGSPRAPTLQYKSIPEPNIRPIQSSANTTWITQK